MCLNQMTEDTAWNCFKSGRFLMKPEKEELPEENVELIWLTNSTKDWMAINENITVIGKPSKEDICETDVWTSEVTATQQGD